MQANTLTFTTISTHNVPSTAYMYVCFECQVGVSHDSCEINNDSSMADHKYKSGLTAGLQLKAEPTVLTPFTGCSLLFLDCSLSLAALCSAGTPSLWSLWY